MHARFLFLIVLVLATVAPPASAQYWPFPRDFQVGTGGGYPLIFDDFDYPQQPGATGTMVGTRHRIDKPGTLFGVNDWLQADRNNGGQIAVTNTKAWYPFQWIERPSTYKCWLRNGNALCPRPQDDTYFLTTLNDQYVPVPSSGGMYRLPSVVRMGTRGWVMDGAQDGDHASYGGHPSIRSGFSARTGTWLARVRLPSFRGLFNNPIISEGLDNNPVTEDPSVVEFIPGFWAQSYWAMEDREWYTLDTRTHSWFEWYYEFTTGGNISLFDSAPSGIPPMWTALLWGYSERVNNQPIPGLYGHPTRWNQQSWAPHLPPYPILGETRPQDCFIMRDNNTGVYVNPSVCWNILTGNAQANPPPYNYQLRAGTTWGQSTVWKPYVYLMTQVKRDTTEFSVFLADESEYGIGNDHGDHIEGFKFMFLSTGPYINYLAPGPMTTFFSTLFGCTYQEWSLPCNAGRELAMDVDWFMYTPDTRKNIELYRADVNWIRVNYFDSQESQGIPVPRRVNSLRYSDIVSPALAPNASLNGPIRLDNGYEYSTAAHGGPGDGELFNPDFDYCDNAGNPAAPRPIRTFDFYVEVTRYGANDYFHAVQLEDDDDGLRHAKVNVVWELCGDECLQAGGTGSEVGSTSHVDRATGKTDEMAGEPNDEPSMGGSSLLTVSRKGFGFIRSYAGQQGTSVLTVTMTYVKDALNGQTLESVSPLCSPLRRNGTRHPVSRTKTYLYDPVAGTVTLISQDGQPFVASPGQPSMVTAGTEALTAYPNPANGRVRIAGIATDRHAEATLRVYDLYGRMIYASKVADHASTVNLDVRAWASGVYHVAVTHGDVVTRTRFTVVR